MKQQLNALISLTDSLSEGLVRYIIYTGQILKSEKKI